MNPWLVLLIVWLLAVSMMTVGWSWQARHDNAGIVDVLWSAGVGGSAVVMAVLGPGAFAPRVLLAILGGLWGVRLAVYLASRIRREGEDGRYRALRSRWGRDQRKWFAFFQFQAALIPLFALPFVAVSVNDATLPIPLVLGALVWAIAVSGESLADAQLARFRADPANRGRACRAGLWKRSRHPNYFFEWVHWLSYVLVAVGSPLWWLSLAGPVVMYLFLRYLSGIPFTEAQSLRTRGDDYRDYQSTTPMLFPRLFMRSDDASRTSP